MKRTVEIDDDLQERIDNTIEEVADWKKRNPLDNEPHDAIHDFTDSAVPIYYSEIDGLWYLYSDKFEEAYENSGIGDKTEENYKQVAIYCYIEEKVWDWWNEHQYDEEEEE